MKKVKLAIALFCLMTIIFSCKKSNVDTSTPKITTGLYVLNQGNYGANNTTLTYYDLATKVATTDYFANANGFGLGDTGSDFIIYGGKMYIVMNVSGNVTVVNTSTAKLINAISFLNAGVNRGPQNIVSYGTNVFVSSTDGTVAVIDTTSLTVKKYITVGTNPAQMVVYGSNLYVSNTGGFTNGYDSTLSVVNLNSLTETQKIKVGTNPGPIVADNSGNVYVACAGNFGNIVPSLVKVSTSSNTVIKTADTAVGAMRFYNNLLYTTGGYSGSPYVRTLSTTDFSATKANFVTDGTSISTAYGLDIDPANGNVYVTDAKNYVLPGAVYCFNNSGVLQYSFSTTPTASPIRVQFVKH